MNSNETVYEQKFVFFILILLLHKNQQTNSSSVSDEYINDQQERHR